MTMKKISKWALLGAVVGALFIIMAIVRYYVLYPDVDKCISYILLGFSVVAISFLYNRELQMTHDIEHIEDFISDWQDRARERARLRSLKAKQMVTIAEAQQKAAKEHAQYTKEYDKFVTEAQEAQENSAVILDESLQGEENGNQ